MPASCQQMSFKSLRRKVIEIPGQLSVEEKTIIMRINKHTPNNLFLKKMISKVNKLAHSL